MIRLGNIWEGTRRLTRSQVAVTLAMPLACLVFLACLSLAGYVPWLYLALFSWAVLLAPLVPDSEMPLVATAGLVLCWLVGAQHRLGLTTLVAALCLLAFHAAAALRALAPPGAELPGALLRRWAGRTTVAGAVTVLTWLVAGGLADGHTLPPLVRALALCVVAGLGLAAWWATRRQAVGS